MRIILSTNIGLWSILQGLFVSKITDRTVLKELPATITRGINRTAFEDNIIQYYEPIPPFLVRTTEDCVKQFGRKLPANFNTIKLASQNTFKSN